MTYIEQEILNILAQIKKIIRLSDEKLSKRYSFVCAKCESIDIDITFLKAGTTFTLPKSPPLEKDVLACVCRQCQYRWQEIPLDQRNNEQINQTQDVTEPPKPPETTVKKETLLWEV